MFTCRLTKIIKKILALGTYKKRNIIPQGIYHEFIHNNYDVMSDLLT